MAICVILDSPENPDNIGAVARAMKNMAFDDLRLVAPPSGWLEKARKMAVGAKDLLEQASVFDDLKEAVHDTAFVVGTTRRYGARRRAFLEFNEAVAKVRQTSAGQKAAIVFGKESKGLSNESLRICDWYTAIPANPHYPSINLAQAVMIVCFSLYGGESAIPRREEGDSFYAEKAEFESTVEAFCGALEHLEYTPYLRKRIDGTFRSLLKRAGLLQSESKMIKGISRRIRERSVRGSRQGRPRKG